MFHRKNPRRGKLVEPEYFPRGRRYFGAKKYQMRNYGSANEATSIAIPRIEYLDPAFGVPTAVSTFNNCSRHYQAGAKGNLVTLRGCVSAHRENSVGYCRLSCFWKFQFAEPKGAANGKQNF